MKNRLWTIPFLLFSVTLIASINQPTISVSADSQDTSSVTAKVNHLSFLGVGILQPTDIVNKPYGHHDGALHNNMILLPFPFYSTDGSLVDQTGFQGHRISY